MDPNFWSLEYIPEGIPKTFAEWGINNAVRQLVSLAPDRFTFTIHGEFDGALPFDLDEECLIRRNGTGYFRGRVVKATRVAVANGEAFQYELAGPWWYLDNLPYQQEWNIATDPEDPGSDLEVGSRSRVIMFHSLTGERQDIDEFVTGVVQYCITEGGALAIGEIDLGSIQPPFSEVRDQTCAELIRSALKWTPDAVSWFDYGASTPELHIGRRGDLEDVELSAVGAPVTAVQLTSRSDLQLNGVLILYEAVNSLNELSWRTVEEDSAGVIGFKSAVFTIELGGSSRTVQSQKVMISQIDVTNIAFWKSLAPWLHQATSVTIGDVRINGTLVSGQSADSTDASSGYSGMGLADFSGSALSSSFSNDVNQKVLAAGQVPYWLEDHFRDATLTAKISYTITNADTGAVEVKEKIPFSHKVKVTDLNSSPSAQTFEQLTSFTPAEDVPEGVAAAYLAACNVLHYEGDLTLVEEEVTEAIGVGEVLNLADGPEEWEEMNALVQTVTERLDTGQTTIRVGPPAHLSVGDFVELQRTQRGRVASYRLAERVTGQFKGTGAQVTGALQTPQANAAPSHLPGKQITVSKKAGDVTAQVESKTDTSGLAEHKVIKADASSSLATKAHAEVGDSNVVQTFQYTNAAGTTIRKVKIDLSDISSAAMTFFSNNVELKIREVDVCMTDPEDEEETIPGKMLVLCSLPYPAS